MRQRDRRQRDERRPSPGPALTPLRLRRLEREREQLSANYRLLIDCAVAPADVWAIAAEFVGEVDCVPFSCPWSHLDAPLAYDGHDVDGYDLSAWQGAAAVHGPRREPGRWVQLAAEYGRRSPCVAFAPWAGDVWLFRHALDAAIIVELGRVPTEPPPGIKSNRPISPSALLVWLPQGPRTRAGELLFRHGSFRFHAAVAGVDRELIARRGVPRVEARNLPGGYDFGLSAGGQLSLAGV